MIEKEDLLSIVPHRGKMLLLSRVINYSMEDLTIEAEYHITEDCLFYDSAAAGVPAWVGFEFIAQAISAFSGIRNRENGEPPRIGFILAVSQVRIDIPFFKTASIITIRAKEIEQLDSLYIFKGEIFLEGRKVLEGRLTVLDADEEQAEAMKRESI
jgi:predicted hotdog family 3-hydroxylacyl-ACP dehydratase